jgi:5'-nucleotidase, C-terminal domain
VTRDVTPSSPITALVDRYRTLSDPLAKRVIGSITADILRAPNAACESALGDVIADSQLAATAPAGLGDAQAAFMNPGGIRADLVFAASGAEGDGNVTYEEAFTVQPFGNSLDTMTLTGAQIETMLEQQFCGTNAAAPASAAAVGRLHLHVERRRDRVRGLRHRRCGRPGDDHARRRAGRRGGLLPGDRTHLLFAGSVAGAAGTREETRGSGASGLLDLDLDVDAGGQLDALQRVDRLRRGLEDVEQALVDAHLEVLAAVLVLVR